MFPMNKATLNKFIVKWPCNTRWPRAGGVERAGAAGLGGGGGRDGGRAAARVARAAPPPAPRAWPTPSVRQGCGESHFCA